MDLGHRNLALKSMALVYCDQGYEVKYFMKKYSILPLGLLDISIRAVRLHTQGHNYRKLEFVKIQIIWLLNLKNCPPPQKKNAIV